MTRYALESEREFARLERQSTFPKYDYRKELAGIEIPRGARILDAGCGSGILCRYLAGLDPSATIMGCDVSEQRLELAAKAASGLRNVSFCRQDLTATTLEPDSFDLVACRYVMEHLPPGGRTRAVSEMLRCLRPGGRAVLIDFDGPLYNLYPQPPEVAQTLRRIEEADQVDLRIGRKLAHFMVTGGFAGVSWRIETIECTGARLEEEIELMREKLENAAPFLATYLGSAEKVQEFTESYLVAMRAPGSTLFYNKFIVTGVKPRTRSNLKLIAS